MRIERCGAIGADDLEVLDPIVVWNAVDVVEDQRHQTTPPQFVLAALLATALLEALAEEALLELAARVCRIDYQHLLKRDRRLMEVADRGATRIEMIGRDPPDLVDVFSEQAVVSAGRPHAKTA
jgi:hypothetical protein